MHDGCIAVFQLSYAIDGHGKHHGSNDDRHAYGGLNSMFKGGTFVDFFVPNHGREVGGGRVWPEEELQDWDE